MDNSFSEQQANKVGVFGSSGSLLLDLKKRWDIHDRSRQQPPNGVISLLLLNQAFSRFFYYMRITSQEGIPLQYDYFLDSRGNSLFGIVVTVVLRNDTTFRLLVIRNSTSELGKEVKFFLLRESGPGNVIIVRSSSGIFF